MSSLLFSLCSRFFQKSLGISSLAFTIETFPLERSSEVSRSLLWPLTHKLNSGAFARHRCDPGFYPSTLASREKQPSSHQALSQCPKKCVYPLKLHITDTAWLTRQTSRNSSPQGQLAWQSAPHTSRQCSDNASSRCLRCHTHADPPQTQLASTRLLIEPK